MNESISFTTILESVSVPEEPSWSADLSPPRGINGSKYTEAAMSVSEETLELMKAAARNGSIDGTLVRSKLVSRLLVWKSSEHEANDPYHQLLQSSFFSDVVPAAVSVLPDEQHDQQQQLEQKSALPVTRGGRSVLGEIQAPNGQQKKLEPVSVGEKTSMKKTAIVVKHDKENTLNWQDQWELLKKAGQFCNFCKKNKEVREIYQSHNLKGTDGEVTCPVLKRCVCQCCGQQGHTIAYCPQNASGTSILKMINQHNRL